MERWPRSRWPFWPAGFFCGARLEEVVAATTGTVEGTAAAAGLPPVWAIRPSALATIAWIGDS